MTTEGAGDPRRRAPAAGRNREPILDVLRRVLPPRGTVIEVGSGTGEHAAFFAHHLPGLTWQPTDRDPEMLASIEGWRQQPGFRFGTPANLQPPLTVDLNDPAWPTGTLSVARFPVAIVSINLLHVAPWPMAERLFAGAGELLMPGRLLFLYGPYLVGGKHLGHGNATFDKSLRAENAEWGLRDLEAVQALGEANQFELAETVEMPVNNLSLIFRRR